MANAWKIARKNNAQLPLVIVIALAIVLVLLGKAQSGLFDKARAHVTDLMAPVLVKVRAPVADFDRWVGSVTEIFTVYEQNLKLKEENARLRQWRNVAIVLQGRVGRYQALLHAVPDPQMNRVLARVIGRASRPFLQTMILDAGRENHALPGQAVVDARGMIGRIYLTGQRTSWVILLTDLNSRIPVTIATSSGSTGNIQAIMTGDNTPFPSLDMVSHTVVRRWRPAAGGTAHRHGGVRQRRRLACGAAGRCRLQPGRGDSQLLQAAGILARHRPVADGSRRAEAPSPATAARNRTFSRYRGSAGQAQAGGRGGAQA